MAAVGRGHMMLLVSCDLSIGSRNHMHMIAVDMANSICAGPHRGIRRGGLGGSICTSNAILTSSALSCGSAASTFATVSRPRRGGRGLVKLLLVAQEQISPGKASCAFGALERFLFSVGTFVTFQVFQSGK